MLSKRRDTGILGKAFFALVAFFVMACPVQFLSPGAYTLVNVRHFDISLSVSPESSEDVARVLDETTPAPPIVADQIVTDPGTEICTAVLVFALSPAAVPTTDVPSRPLRC